MTEITHDIARYTARAASYEQYAECQGRVKMPYVNQGICHARHDDELGASSDEDIQWTLCQNLEIVGGQCQSHGEHDDAENDGLGSSAHLVEGMWEEECKHSYTYYKNRCIIGKPTAQPLKKLKHNLISFKVLIILSLMFPLFQIRVQRYLFSCK